MAYDLSYLEVELETDEEWEGDGLEDALLIQGVLNLLQFHHLGRKVEPCCLK